MMRRIPTYILTILLGLSLAQAQVQADFQASVTQGCAPVIVNFQDLSNQAVAWEWDLGVSTSTLQNPGALYLQAGVYDIRLIVTAANGQKDTLLKTQYVEISDEPQAGFRVDRSEVCTFESIQFTNQSSVVGGQITSYLWDFGDGNTSTQPNPVHQYATAGNYPISLAIRTNFGCSDQVIFQNYITVNAPDPEFSADQLIACGPPLEVKFQSQTQTGVHEWNFGNGQSATSLNPTITYQTFGSFDVSHIVTDSDGCTDTLTKQSYINIGVNTLSIYAQDSSLCLGDSVYFYTNAASNSNVIWDFGNGDSSTLLNPAYVYPQPGAYTARATISDQSGCSVNLSIPIIIFPYPTVDFKVADTTLGCDIPFGVQFQFTGTPGQQYQWYFGDGKSSTQQNPFHEYTKADTVNVSLRVTGANGCRSSLRKSQYIKLAPTRMDFDVDKRGGCAPLTVRFGDSTQSAYPIVNWQWDFGDGNTSNLAHPTHTYLDTGSYDVRLVVTNSRGCTDTLLKRRYVSAGFLPQLDFGIDTNQACAFTEVQLFNYSTGAGKFIWYFADGDTAMSREPLHGFGSLGPQDIILLGSDRGCKDTLVKHNIINILAPLPILSVSQRKVCRVPTEVYFSNLSIGADHYFWEIDSTQIHNVSTISRTVTQPQNLKVYLTVSNDSTGCTVRVEDSVVVSPVFASFEVDTMAGCHPLKINYTNTSANANRFLWHFTNKDSTQQLNPTRTYQKVGNYETRLIATNNLGCRDTMMLGPIRALGTNARIGWAGDTTGCVPMQIGIQDQSFGTAPITHWAWDLGDGTQSNVANPTHIYDSMSYYTIKLTVRDADGCVDSIQKTNAIYATEPVPDFRITPGINCEDRNSTFVSLSTGAGLSYLWDFGDGDSSTLANPRHAYPDTGYYDVHLTVTDVNGCDSSILKRQIINIRELQASFTADTTYTTCPPLSVNFAADTSFPHQDISYTWDFGDGATSTDPIPTHIYTLPGIYTVSLIVSTPTGCSDTMTLEQLIQVEGPDATFSFDPGSGCPGTTIAFDGQSDAGINLSWVFGDGNTGVGRQVSHTYLVPGTYTPVLVAEDSGGCKVFHVSQEKVRIYQPPTAAFSSDTLFCEEGTTQFVDQSQFQTPIQSWKWSFGTGDSSKQVNPIYTYSQVGRYDVSLIVQDGNGCSDTLLLPQQIEVAPAPKPILLAAKEAGCIPFNNSYEVITPGHPTPFGQYNWDLGYQGATANGQQISFTYPEAGRFIVSVVTVDQKGCRGDTSMVVEAWGLPRPQFDQTDSMGCAPISIQFFNQTPDSLQSMLWTFGEGSSTSVANPIHRFQVDGHYSVSLEVVDINGCKNAMVKPNLIRLAHPTANFDVSDTVICPNVPLIFTDLSETDTALSAWIWDFGQGDSSDKAQPTTQYTNPGLYQVKLKVADVFGCEDSLIRPRYIRVLEDVEPEPLDLHALSIQDEQRIEVLLQAFANERDDFGAYHILREDGNGNFQEVGIAAEINKLSFTDVLSTVEDGPYCYKVLVENHCGTKAREADAPTHCTIDLSARVDTERVDLQWTPYIGWEDVEVYAVFRVEDYNPKNVELIAEVPGDQYSFTDYDMHCTETYSYRVEAVGNQRQHSLSDTSFAAPPHRFPSTPSHILRASVENNEYVLVEWAAAAIEEAVSVVVERSVGNRYKTLYSQAFKNQNTKFQDLGTDVHGQSYAYRVFTVDTCGDYTPLGYIGKTILLEVVQQQGQVVISWSPYEGWVNGVGTYEVEVYNEQTGTFELVETLDENITSLIDPKAERGQGQNCYRVVARQAGQPEVVSYSNEDCTVLDPLLYTPTAFSPNGDGRNDFFMIKGVFVDHIFIQIYDRWGKLIYEGQELQAGWDGSTLKGGAAPEGVYVYHMAGKGLSGETIKKVGSVTLIR